MSASYYCDGCDIAWPYRSYYRRCECCGVTLSPCYERDALTDGDATALQRRIRAEREMDDEDIKRFRRWLDELPTAGG